MVASSQLGSVRIAVVLASRVPFEKKEVGRCQDISEE